MTRVLAVGEAPSRRSPNSTPLGSLRVKVLVGLALGRDVEVVGRNLFDKPMPRSGKGSAFQLDLARERAVVVLRSLQRVRRYDAIWLVGKRVARAFRASGVEYLEPIYLYGVTKPVYVVPHPSGVNRWWNEEENQEAWRKFVEEHAGPIR